MNVNTLSYYPALKQRNTRTLFMNRMQSTADVELEYIRYLVDVACVGGVPLSYNKWRLAVMLLKLKQIEELTKQIKN